MNDISFFHSFERLDIKGVADPALLRQYADTIFSTCPVEGKTVLDIGAWDGYYSFEAERRGAARVLATDHFCWSGPGWGTKAGFDYVHGQTRSRVESHDVDVFDLDPTKLGTFDAVLFLGVLYHLKDPFGGLEKAAAMAGDCLIVETQTDMNDTDEPVMRYYLGSELNGDGTNFWAPNILCLENMMRELGFRRFDTWVWPAPAKSGRVIMHGWR
jgi:tRNA (mo5U34)-methyltransferase